ncbi:hypothetical protein P280DRAFT_424642, partial [Massarina eburnea CBS 473.64]
EGSSQRSWSPQEGQVRQRRRQQGRQRRGRRGGLNLFLYAWHAPGHGVFGVQHGVLIWAFSSKISRFYSTWAGGLTIRAGDIHLSSLINTCS